MNVHDYSIVEVCMRLHACDTGSGDGIPDDERGKLVEWLRWRTMAGWQDYKSRSREVDSAVLDLALAVLNQADDKDSDCDGEAA